MYMQILIKQKAIFFPLWIVNGFRNIYTKLVAKLTVTTSGLHSNCNQLTLCQQTLYQFTLTYTNWLHK